MIEITLNKHFRFLGLVSTAEGFEVLFEDGDEDMIRFRVVARDLTVIAAELAMADRAAKALLEGER
jgi:hypothetical protein